MDLTLSKHVRRTDRYCANGVDDLNCYGPTIVFSIPFLVILLHVLRNFPIICFLKRQCNKPTPRFRVAFSRICSMVSFIDFLRVLLVLSILASYIAEFVVQKEHYGNEVKAAGSDLHQYLDVALLQWVAWGLFLVCLCDEIRGACQESRALVIFTLAQLVGESFNMYRLVKNFSDHKNNHADDGITKNHSHLLMIWCIVNVSLKFGVFFLYTCFNRDWRSLRRDLKHIIETSAEGTLTESLIENEYFSELSSIDDPCDEDVEEFEAVDGERSFSVRSRKKRTPEEYSGLLYRLTFAWLDELMRKGYEKPLEDCDFYRVLHRDESSVLAENFETSWNEVIHERETKKKEQTKVHAATHDSGYVALRESDDSSDDEASEEKGDLKAVLKSLHRAGVLTPFYEAAFFKIVYDTLNFVPPQLMHAIISYMNSDDDPEYYGYLMAFLLLVSAGVQTFFLHVYFHKCFRTGMRVRSALLTAIYKKSLILSPSARQKKTTGEIVNLMSADCQRLQNLFPYLHVAWSAPYVIILSLIFLWAQLKYAVFVAVGVILFVMVPLTNFVAQKIKAVQKEVMKIKDERIRSTGEAISSMKVIKLYGWEAAFREKICDARDEELKLLRTYVLWRAVGRTLWTATPIVVTLCTFAAFIVFQNGTLDAATAFTSLTLLNILRFPLAMLPNILNSSMEAAVSLRRISLFFESNELHKESYISDASVSEVETAVKVKKGNFFWDDARRTQALKNVSLNLKCGSLNLVTGEVGSGKSALLKMLTGELQPQISSEGRVVEDSFVTINGSLGYSAQVPWIQNATVRDNVLFGLNYDREWYRRVVYACALTDDFKQLPDGDQTEIGERGINLSGGQKARVSLARAIYSRADIVLLETCFEAVDEHVGEHLWKECFSGLLREPHPVSGKKRTVIVVTHALKHMADTDHIIVMGDGKIVVQGSYNEVKNANVAEFDRLMDSMKKTQEKGHEHTTGSEEKEDLDEEEDEAMMKEKLERRGTSITSKKGSKGLTGAEERGVGQVSWSVYANYISALGGAVSILLIIGFFTAKTAMDFITTRWLATWSEHVQSNKHENSRQLISYFTHGEKHQMIMPYEQANHSVINAAVELLETSKKHSSNYYLSIYTYLSLFTIGIIIVQVIMISLTSLRASRTMHHDLVYKITRAPMAFFDVTPIGRILNRFSKDVYTLDEALPASLFSFLSTTFTVLGTIFSIAYVAPMFLAAVPVLIVGYRFVQKYYIATSRELKRWDSVLRSPIYSFFSETLDGSGTIRAFGVEGPFILKNHHQLDRNLEAYYLSVSANRWLAVRLEFIGNFLVFFAALFITLNKDNIDPSLSGLALSYALGITQTLNWTVRMVSELETNIVSVERINDYIEIKSEAPAESPDPSKAPPANSAWPMEGKLELVDVRARYREGLELVLKGLTVTIEPHQKVGIVGRTGAGKSSLFLVLMRLVEPCGGQVLIDGYDTKNLGLETLRSKLAIIPQDPVMFCGTLRENLDPKRAFSDEQMWTALELSRLKGFVSGLQDENGEKKGLDMVINEGGSNFSFGQRQLICIARAVLRNNKILLLDEATSGIDLATDAMIQETIQTTFSDKTVLTIAHRIETILMGDKVMVMDNGQIAEFDDPSQLLKDPTSIFSGLVEKMKKTRKR